MFGCEIKMDLYIMHNYQAQTIAVARNGYLSVGMKMEMCNFM